MPNVSWNYSDKILAYLLEGRSNLIYKNKGDSFFVLHNLYPFIRSGNVGTADWKGLFKSILYGQEHSKYSSFAVKKEDFHDWLEIWKVKDDIHTAFDFCIYYQWQYHPKWFSFSNSFWKTTDVSCNSCWSLKSLFSIHDYILLYFLQVFEILRRISIR